MGGKGGRCIGLTTLPLHVSTVLKSGSLNLLETSVPVQACNGIALPLYNISYSELEHGFQQNDASDYCREN